MESLTSPNRRASKQTTEILEQDHATCGREPHSKCSCWNAYWAWYIGQGSPKKQNQLYICNINIYVYMLCKI